jgi:hypothetical protein
LFRQIDRGPGTLEFDDKAAGGRPMQQAVELRAGAADPAPDGDRHALGSRIQMRQNTKQQIAVELGERHPDYLLQVEKCRGVCTGLDDAVIWFADDQQRTVRLNRSREMNLFPFAVRKIGFSERWGSVRMRRQLNPLGFPRWRVPCHRDRSD